ncbi:MAG: dethiobiotin synthase [Balneolaceae bacterium]
MKFPNELFISGTDTDIGKTVISSMLVAGLNAGYWKPVQAGRDPITDREFVEKVTDLPESHFYKEAYDLTEPMSPHAAAKIDGVEIKLDEFNLPNYSQKHLIVEGAGGLIVPLNEREYVIDLMSHLNLPTLLVAKSGLGTLNHTLLSLEALRSRGIEVFGVVMVGDDHPSNFEAIKHYGNISRLIQVPFLKEINKENLIIQFKKSFSE